MFISKAEKLQINERLDALAASFVEEELKINERFEGVVSSLVKVSEQQDKAQDGIPNIRKTIKSLMDNIWELDSKIKNLDAKVENLNAKVVNFQSTATLVTAVAEQSKNMRIRIAELERANDVFTKNDKALFAGVASLGRRKTVSQPPKQVVIPPESVQALKDAGFWDDPVKRVTVIDQLIKDEQIKEVLRKKEMQKERQRQHSRNYYLRKKAEKLAKETA
jgi:archaellum component FlaC